MNGPLRPLTVVQLVPALQGGGAERSTLEIGAALVRGGHRSIVVSAGGRLVAALVAAGSEHVAMDLVRKTPLAFRHVITLRRLLKRWRPDVVHARSRLPAWVGELALRGWGAGRPHFVTTVHGLNSPGCWSAVMTRGERVICVSETVRNYVLRHYPDVPESRLTVIPRGIDAEERHQRCVVVRPIQCPVEIQCLTHVEQRAVVLTHLVQDVTQPRVGIREVDTAADTPHGFHRLARPVERAG